MCNVYQPPVWNTASRLQVLTAPLYINKKRALFWSMEHVAQNQTSFCLEYTQL